jgi:hypothetical protein
MPARLLFPTRATTDSPVAILHGTPADPARYTAQPGRGHRSARRKDTAAHGYGEFAPDPGESGVVEFRASCDPAGREDLDGAALAPPVEHEE